MNCYKGKSFCASDCTNESCSRHNVHIDNPENLPVCYADFKEYCVQYRGQDEE